MADDLAQTQPAVAPASPRRRFLIDRGFQLKYALFMAGAGLLGVVVGKLFLVDLAHHGTVERIVSFVVVGILLLVIGWFAPVPPRNDEGGAL